MPHRLISSGSPYEASVGCSRAVVVGDRIVTSGTAPIWPDGSCDPDVTVQARRCLPRWRLEIAAEAIVGSA
jgi:hypothetical protein